MEVKTQQEIDYYMTTWRYEISLRALKIFQSFSALSHSILNSTLLRGVELYKSKDNVRIMSHVSPVARLGKSATLSCLFQTIPHFQTSEKSSIEFVEEE